MIGIYVHIPYCRTICPYCDFVRRPLAEGHVPAPFIESLLREIAAFEGPRDADSIFFGGGTPSLLHGDDLARVLAALAARFTLHDAEITLEANPDDVTSALVAAWKALGVNRVSLGVQSFNDDALRYLGRRHDADTARRACETVAEHFENWNLDLMFGAHPISAWESSVLETVRLAPAHVSAYGLTYEPGTPFGKRSDEAIDDETYITIYRQTLSLLSEYRRYEVSNFAKPGRECQHNMHYWRNESYAGFGPAAYSYIDGVRARNLVHLGEYLERPGGKAEALPLSEREERVETLIQLLRLDTGLHAATYRQRFGRDLGTDYGQPLADLVARGLLDVDGELYRPTTRGFELNNEIGLALVDT